MPRQFNKDDVRLLDYESVELKHDEPDELSVYDAVAKAGADRVMHRFIYLKSRCSQNGAKQAVGYLSEAPVPAKTYGVKASSLDSRAVLDIVGRAGCTLQSHEDLIWQQLSDVFSTYLESLKTDMAVAPNFMQPYLRGLKQGRPKALPLIMRYMQGREPGGNVRVLSAHAGVGKTTLARYLVRELARRCDQSRIIPIFVEAHHWERLDLGQIDGLWEIIKNSLDVIDRTNECSRRLSADLFQHALRQGYLSFVFDGFDELCGSEVFDADSVLKELAYMARESEARVLVTTRTLFWDAQIHAPPKNVSVWSLDSFNSQQAHGYFRDVFGQNQPATKVAKSLYSQLRKESQTPPEHTGSVRDQFVNLPLCIRMIADFVEPHTADQATIPPTPPGKSVLQGMLLGFCEREMRRIGIVSSAQGQLASFVDRAVESDQLNPVFNVEDLIYTAGGIDENDLERLDRHGLLDHEPGSAQYRFRYDFLGPHLRAVAVAEWLTVRGNLASFEPTHLSKIMRGEAEGQGFVFEQLLTLLGPGSVDAVMSQGRKLRGDGPAGSFVFHLARELLARRQLPDEEVTRTLLAGLSGVSPETWDGVLSGWEFRGTLENLHLAGVKLDRCRFRDVVFRQCVVDGQTTFSGCDFDGDLRFESSGYDRKNNWARVTISECHKKSAAARIAWSDILGGHAASREESATEVLRIGLEKFWYSGQIRQKLRHDDWSKGLLGRTNRSEPLLDRMRKAGLVDIDQRNRIVFDSGSFRDLQNYMDNAQLSGRIRDVYELLKHDDRV